MSALVRVVGAATSVIACATLSACGDDAGGAASAAGEERPISEKASGEVQRCLEAAGLRAVDKGEAAFAPHPTYVQVESTARGASIYFYESRAQAARVEAGLATPYDAAQELWANMIVDLAPKIDDATSAGVRACATGA